MHTSEVRWLTFDILKTWHFTLIKFVIKYYNYPLFFKSKLLVDHLLITLDMWLVKNFMWKFEYNVKWIRNNKKNWNLLYREKINVIYSQIPLFDNGVFPNILTLLWHRFWIHICITSKWCSVIISNVNCESLKIHPFKKILF